MFDDRLEIYSPGGMADGTLIQDQDIEKVPSNRRNPSIAEIFHRLDYIERRGSGFKKIRAETANLYGYTDDYAPQFVSTPTAFHVILKNINYGQNLTEQTENLPIADKLADKLPIQLTPGEETFFRRFFRFWNMANGLPTLQRVKSPVSPMAA